MNPGRVSLNAAEGRDASAALSSLAPLAITDHLITGLLSHSNLPGRDESHPSRTPIT